MSEDPKLKYQKRFNLIQILSSFYKKRPYLAYPLYAICGALVVASFLPIITTPPKVHVLPIKGKTVQTLDHQENDCKNVETLISSQELSEKIVQIISLNGDEINRDSEEWNDVYTKIVIEPLNAAIQTHCEIIKNKNSNKYYTDEDVRDFIREYIKILNNIVPTIEFESKGILKITIKDYTFRYDKESYMVSVNMNEILAVYIEKGILEKLTIMFDGDLEQHLISILEQQSIDGIITEVLESTFTQSKNIEIKQRLMQIIEK